MLARCTHRPIKERMRFCKINATTQKRPECQLRTQALICIATGSTPWTWRSMKIFFSKMSFCSPTVVCLVAMTGLGSRQSCLNEKTIPITIGLDQVRLSTLVTNFTRLCLTCKGAWTQDAIVCRRYDPVLFTYVSCTCLQYSFRSTERYFSCPRAPRSLDQCVQNGCHGHRLTLPSMPRSSNGRAAFAAD